MGMGDCIKCWESPCVCGYEYRNYTEAKLTEFINGILVYHEDETVIRVLYDILANRYIEHS